MKKLLYLLFFVPVFSLGADGTVLVIDKIAPKNGAFVGVVDSSQSVNNVTNFNGNLSASETTAQKAFDVLDDLIVSSGSIAAGATNYIWNSDSVQDARASIKAITDSADIFNLKGKSDITIIGFTGSGLNDLTVSGTYTGRATVSYKIEIDGTGSPNTFKWSDDDGATYQATGVAITGSPQTLNNGVVATFGSVSGHTSGDYWRYGMTAYTGDAIDYQNPVGTSLFTLEHDGEFYISGVSAQDDIAIRHIDGYFNYTGDVTSGMSSEIAFMNITNSGGGGTIAADGGLTSTSIDILESGVMGTTGDTSKRAINIDVSGTADTNIGMQVTSSGGTDNSSIAIDGGDLWLTDNVKITPGTLKDSSLDFDGDSLNIIANAVVATDDIIFTSDKFEHSDGAFNLNDDDVVTTGTMTAKALISSKIEVPFINKDYKLQSWLPIATSGTVENPYTFERATAPLTTPTSDASGDCLHADVVYIPGGWNGYTYWMVMSPFTASNTDVENPEILVSSNAVDWIDPGTNPIDAWPGGTAFHSDPCLMLYKNTMYAYWREQDAGVGDIIKSKTSTDGVTWSAEIDVLDIGGATPATAASPIIRNIDGTFYMWTVDTVASPQEMHLRTSTYPTGGWSAATTCALNIVGAQEVWHMNILYDGDAFYMAWSTPGDFLFSRSFDGINWRTNGAVVYGGGGSNTWDESAYTAALIRRPDRPYFDVFYSGINATPGTPVHRIGNGKLHWSVGLEGNLYGYRGADNLKNITAKDSFLRVRSENAAILITALTDSTASNNDPRINFRHGATPATKATMGWDSSGSLFNMAGAGVNANVGISMDASGNIGINDITPTQALTVNGMIEISKTGESLKLTDTSATGSPFISFNQTTTGRRSFIQHNDAGDNLILASEFGDITFKTASNGAEATRLVIGETGSFDFQAGSLTTTGDIVTTGDITTTGVITTTNDIFIDSDSSVLGFGANSPTPDATIGFDSDSLNIIANAVTAGNALEFTAGSYLFNDGVITIDYTGDTAVLVRDLTAQAAGVGGGIDFSYKYKDAGNFTTGGGIRLEKTNSTDSDYSTNIAIRNRLFGSAAKTTLLIKNTGELVAESPTNTVLGAYTGLDLDMIYNPASNDAANNTTGVNITANVAGANEALNILGGQMQSIYSGTGRPTGSMGGFNALSTINSGAAAGTLTVMRAGNYGINNNDADTIVTTAITIQIQDPTNAGTFTDTYGLYVNNQTAGTQTNDPWGIWDDGNNWAMDGDSATLYLGEAQDASVIFDGDSLNITANAVTASDTMELTAAAHTLISAVPSLTLEQNEAGSGSASINFSQLGDVAGSLSRNAGGFSFSASTGGANIQSRLFMAIGDEQVEFNTSAQGFFLNATSMTFLSGDDRPILDWDTDGWLEVTAGTTSIVFTDNAGASNFLIYDSDREPLFNMDSLGNSVFSGDLTFINDGSGFCYAEISTTSNQEETAIAGAGTKVQVAIFGADGLSNNTTPDHTNDHIVIILPGIYMINVSATINSVAGIASKLEISVWKNNGATEILTHMDRSLGGGGSESGFVGMSGLADLALNDTIEIWIENEDNTQNYVVEDIVLSLFMIGGT